ncbi:MAG: MoxR family ATPase [Lachnospiraceae bacterium]|nr:MoxR family ATPase [Lachnospiraceae bacterium]
MNAKIEAVTKQIGQVIKGKDDIIYKLLSAIIAGGHILLEDIPGVGKTTLAVTVSRTMSLKYKRMQFTPDVLPSDLIGFNLYNNQTGSFEYKEGAVFCNLFLADEINRTSPKTQSALLEVMEEAKATVDGVTRTLPSPFIVIATQNPFGSSGTQKLPESQLDRFMIRLSMGYPDHDNAVAILKGNVGDVLNTLTGLLEENDVASMQQEAKKIFVHDSIYDYIVRLTEATRNETYFSLGLSPRASLSLLKMAQATAFIENCNYVLPEHVQSIFNDVSSHRLVLSSKAKMNGYTLETAMKAIVDQTPLPKM